MDPSELKQAAGENACEHVCNGMTVGLGTGSTAYYAIRKLGQRVREEGLDILGIPTSIQSDGLAKEFGVPLTTLAKNPVVDVTIDGADEVDPSLNLIKGMGGALLREKMIAQATKMQIIVIDDSKLVEVLGTRSPLPVEVVQFEWEHTARRLEKMGGEPVLRKKDDVPYITDNQNYILDVRFKSIEDPQGLEAKLLATAGVVETGLFLGLTKMVICASPEGIRVIE